MSVRCIQCHTLLIPEAEQRAPEVKKFVNDMDWRMYGGIGSLGAGLIGGLIFQNIGAAIFLGMIGGALGRFIAQRKKNQGE